MSNGATPIDPKEPILRRIIKGPGYYDPQKKPPLERGAFTPNKRDDDGLSFYLERELSIDDVVRLANRPPSEVVIIRLTAADIYRLGLSLVPVMREGDLPGHVVVPEMNWCDYSGPLRKRIRNDADSLVRLGLVSVVFGA